MKRKKIEDIKLPKNCGKIDEITLAELFGADIPLSMISKNLKIKTSKIMPLSPKHDCLFIAINCVFITAAIVLLLTEVI